MQQFVYHVSGPIPDNLQSCVNKEYFTANPAPPVQQWQIDSRGGAPIAHSQSSIPHLETNGNNNYRYAVPVPRPSSVNEVPPDSMTQSHRGMPASIAPGACLIPSVHSTRPTSTSPIVMNRQSPQPVGGKGDVDMALKE